jgi:hypothetical protein
VEAIVVDGDALVQAGRILEAAMLAQSRARRHRGKALGQQRVS